MSVFRSIQDDDVARNIRAATARVVYGAPGVSPMIAEALVACVRGGRVAQIEIVLDGDEEACRLGYCDAPSLERLHSAVTQRGMSILRHPGIRLGVLLTDEQVLIWAPTPLMFEAPRDSNAPNGLALTPQTLEALPDALGIGLTASPDDAELGTALLRHEEVANVAEAMKSSPCAPFNLSRLTRVVSSKFQFVETTLRGVELTLGAISLDGLIASTGEAAALYPLLQHAVQPVNIGADKAIPVPVFIEGEQAFNRDGEPLTRPVKHADICGYWSDLIGRYVLDLPGFGQIIRHSDKLRFETERKAFEAVLRSWVAVFRTAIESELATHVERIAAHIRERMERAGPATMPPDTAIRDLARKGLERLRMMEPSVKVVYKNIAVESTRDEAFLAVLRRVVPAQELKGWFHIFDTALAVEFSNRA